MARASNDSPICRVDLRISVINQCSYHFPKAIQFGLVRIRELRQGERLGLIRTRELRQGEMPCSGLSISAQMISPFSESDLNDDVC